MTVLQSLVDLRDDEEMFAENILFMKKGTTFFQICRTDALDRSEARCPGTEAEHGWVGK